jgi:hypothetical protein
MNPLRHLEKKSLDRETACRKASIYTGQKNTEKRRHTSMPRVEIEPTIPMRKQQRPTPYTARPL